MRPLMASSPSMGAQWEDEQRYHEVEPGCGHQGSLSCHHGSRLLYGDDLVWDMSRWGQRIFILTSEFEAVYTLVSIILKGGSRCKLLEFLKMGGAKRCVCRKNSGFPEVMSILKK